MAPRLRLTPAGIGRAALAALHEELALHPKPGLVSPSDPGAHADMDAGTFRRSIEALDGFFAEAARAGSAAAPFGTLRALGMAAEARMLAATGGVNTHRGALFGLGLSGRRGRAARRHGPRLRRPCAGARGGGPVGWLPPARAAAQSLQPRRRRGAAPRRRGRPPRGGERLRPSLRGGAPGAGGEPARAAPTRRAASVQCLLSLVATLPDTNLLWRGGTSGLAFARRGAARFLAGGGVHGEGWEAEVSDLHRQFTGRRLSPGGSADLLAAALMVHALQGGEAGR